MSGNAMGQMFITVVRNLILANPGITIRQLAHRTGYAEGSVHNAIHSIRNDELEDIGQVLVCDQYNGTYEFVDPDNPLAIEWAERKLEDNHTRLKTIEASASMIAKHTDKRTSLGKSARAMSKAVKRLNEDLADILA